MIRKLFICLLSVLASAALCSAAPPQERKAGATPPEGARRLSPKQINTIRAFHPWLGQAGAKSKKPLRSSKLGVLADGPRKTNDQTQVNASGSSIQGWRTTYEYTEPAAVSGWYDLNADGTQTLKWEYQNPDPDGLQDFPFNTAFRRNGKMYGFYGEMLFAWLLWGHGSFSETDGTISDFETFGDDLELMDMSTYVITCVYDENKDTVYAYTLNSDGTSYMLQAVNPDTWEFSVISPSVLMEDICVGMAYNPVDGCVYGFTPDSRFVKLDTSTGDLTLVLKTSLPVNTQLYGMAYSPLDKTFMVVVPPSDSGEYVSSLYTIDPLAPELKKCADLPNTVQYRILTTPDKMSAPEAPVAPQIVSIDFIDGATQGNAAVRMPDKSFGGEDLSGTLTLRAMIDGNVCSEQEALPGEVAEVAFSDVEEGIRSFSFTVISGEYQSAAAEQSLYVGYDTPFPPTNICLEAGSLTWEAPEESVHGGYIDTDNLSYNVFLNGVKINQEPVVGCSYTFEMPEAVYSKQVAQVEADNHGHLSDRAFSNEIKYGNPLPLPFSMTPTQPESELITTVTQRNKWYQWKYTLDYHGKPLFACYTQEYDRELEEWFYLPPIEIPQTEGLIAVSFDFLARNYENGTNLENIAVGFGSAPTPDQTVIARNWENLDDSEWVRLTAYYHPQPGTNYIGFRTLTHEDGDMIGVRNISVTATDLPSTIPASVSGLKAEALPAGALKAKVSFTLPLLDVTGNDLTDTELTASVKSEAETISVSGAPGSLQNVQISTMQGLNTITVVVSNSNEGLDASTKIFTGVDVPVPISAYTCGHTAAYNGLHIEWQDPVEGVNGGYVDPSKVTYSLCVYDPEEYDWKIAFNLGHVNSYDAVFEVPEGIAEAEIGLLAQNDQGHSGQILVLSGAVGTPWSLPMYETFSEEYGEKYAMYVAEHPDDSYTDGWGYNGEAFPYWIEKPSPEGPGAFLGSGFKGEKCRVTMPAFSTENVSSAGIQLPVYALKGQNRIKVYARSFNIEPELIGTYEGTLEPEWAVMRFHLPAKFMNQKWVELLVDGEFESDEESILAFAQYKIKTFYSDDLAVTKLDAPVFPLLGNSYEISATVCNEGLQTSEAPAMVLKVMSSDKTLATLAMSRADDGGTLPELAEARYTATWTPDAECAGEIRLVAEVSAHDMDPSNDSKSAVASVGRGNSPAVTDLKASAISDGALLTWTPPTVETGAESFESFAPFSYGDMLGDFKCVNLDGEESNYFSNWNFPYQVESKAWQVISISAMENIISEAGYDNSVFSAADGDNVIAAFSPFSLYVGSDLVSDRWIISPECREGSDFSFKMRGGVDGYVEPIEVLVSSDTDNLDNFSLLDNTSLISTTWKEYTYSLPANARHFAIRYRGDCGSSFFALLDDIHYSPVEESPSLEGYDIYRNGALIAENVKADASYVDTFEATANETSYNIKPVVRKDSNLLRGYMSNTAILQTSGIDDINASYVVSRTFWNVNGIQVDAPGEGVTIVREILDNGTVITRKIVSRK